MPRKDKCPRCGSTNRIDAGFTLQRIAFDDPYCGNCGANFPRRRPQVADPRTRPLQEPKGARHGQ